MVDFVTLNFDYQPLQLVEGFQSMIWTERFRDHGEFQLVAPLSNSRIRNLVTTQFLGRMDSRYFMYIESIVEDEEKGIVTVKGREASSVLKYRPTSNDNYTGTTDFVWNITGTPTAIAVQILRYALMETYAETEYDVVGLTVTNSAGAVGTSRTLGIPIGTSSYDSLKGQLDEVNVGFRLLRTYGTPDVLTMNIYLGTDKSSTLVFSPLVDNLSNTIRTRSIENFATDVALYQDSPRGTQAYYYNIWYTQLITGRTPSNGLGRRAIPLSMAGVSASAYESYAVGQITQNNPYLNYVDGQIPSDAAGYVYGTDYNLGDIVGLNYNGVNSNARVIEHITSVDSEGVRNYPTLEPV